MDETLNSVLDIDPAATRTAVEQAADIINAEVLEALPSAPAPVQVQTVTALPPAVPVERDRHDEALDDDMDHAREQLKQIIDDGRSALNGIMELASAGDEPRAYEVIAELMQATIEANKTLITLHEIRKKAKKADAEAKAKLVEAQGGAASTPGSPSVNIDKAVFVGRASDLLRELQQVKKQTKAALSDGKA